jgi:DNA-binding NarL/FixJ family response regulator
LPKQGKPSKEAASLYVSVKTIETHRKHILDKLRLHSIAELTKYAIREGDLFLTNLSEGDFPA